jgi:hypothetical protein
MLFFKKWGMVSAIIVSTAPQPEGGIETEPDATMRIEILSDSALSLLKCS